MWALIHANSAYLLAEGFSAGGHSTVIRITALFKKRVLRTVHPGKGNASPKLT